MRPAEFLPLRPPGHFSKAKSVDAPGGRPTGPERVVAGDGVLSRAAGFPREKSIRQFDFDADPIIDPAAIHTLAKCDWVKKGLPLCLIGDSGTGKSHLLIALGTGAAMHEYRVTYVLATKLVNELVEAADERLLAKTIARRRPFARRARR